ncbi:mechanosensitive ion channel family protein [Sediminibacillus massiliensis]|uniref:mechanosensitive ion channel family protein n=1 Tax=Sediminibacillus massiliensis TaxID=1926277 RepID=UPI0009887F52|nr:mechanosensitive ion channel domain-containing protein [Sediminibacillus massiliensis]
MYLTNTTIHFPGNIIPFFQTFDWIDFTVYGVCVFLIICARWLFLLFFNTVNRNRGIPGRKTPVYFFVNWLAFYGILIFTLVYFADSEWLTAEIFSVGSVKVTASLILIALLIITFANRASKVFTKYLLPNIYHRHQLDQGMQYTFNRMFHYTVMVVAFIISLTTVGIDLSALTVFAGVLGVGIGFGMQNIASNFISGIILLFERPIKVGDRVIVNEIMGDIEKISMRATIIRTIDNEHIIVPNSYFLEEHVVNRSYSDPTLRLKLPVGVAFGTDVEKVRELLLKAARDEHENSEGILMNPEPFVHFVGFGDSSLDFELFIWIEDPRFVIVTRSNLNFRINKLFNEHQVEIPFPQRDLNIRNIDENVIQKLKR